MTTARERPHGMKVIHVRAFMHPAHSRKDRPMHAVIGRVRIKPDRADETLAMLGDRGVAMLQGMAGSAGGYWARSREGDIIQHSFWLFDTDETPGRPRRTSTSSATCPMRQQRSSASMYARSSGALEPAAGGALDRRAGAGRRQERGRSCER
jgi:hypothetical protein